MRRSTTILLLVLGAPGLGAQGFLLTRTSGEQIEGQPVAIQGAGASRALELATATGKVTIPFRDILGLQGPAPRVTAPVAVYLHGGGELKGELAGGDEDGDHLLVKSVALGARKLPVDRLASIVFRERTAGVGPAAFILPGDATCSEALFRKARRGFDLIPGELERFTPAGVLFADAGRSMPRLFRYATLAALSIRGGESAKRPADWMLVTVTGDRLRVALTRVQSATIEVETEFGPVTLSRGQIAALTLLVGNRNFLSDLDPVRVAELGSDGDVSAEPLFPFRRDRTVSEGMVAERRSPAAGFLVAGGHTYGKGLGAHSRCVLTYRVPAKMTRFHARVAIDDEVKLLGVMGDVDVRVRQGDKVLFQHQGLRCGQPPKNLGVLRVTPGALLTLEVGFGKGLFLGDRLDWLSAVFLH